MIDFEELNKTTEKYKILKITRPNYKNALLDRDIVIFTVRNLRLTMNYKFLSDDQKKSLEKKIEELNHLLYHIELFIVKCRIKFDLRKNHENRRNKQ